ncbi:8584_t:CDS:2 [Diversispora eburnea]|uniref:8584_t:CDS:1 n=1 Tax=Diversispora eburnea TaxID=1213867 RepID=A0A9N8YLY0_9GLOM|nr:8584_t:CDS:2 [Diversispora eburnea]
MRSSRTNNRRSNSFYSQQKVYEPSPSFEASEQDSDEYMEEEINKEAYQSEDEMDGLDDLLQEEEEEELEMDQELEEPDEIEEPEELDELEEVDIEEIDDADATPLDDDDFDEEEEEEEEEEIEDEEDEQSDYEEVIPARRTRGSRITIQTTQLKQSSRSKQKQQKDEPPPQAGASRKRGRILTKRQRAKLNENYEQDLLQLPMEPMKKKQLTEEEIQLKKSEIARRRKHQSIQPSKKRSKDQDDTDSVHNHENGSSMNLPSYVYHYVQDVQGCSLSIPEGISMPIKFEKGPKYPPPVPLCSISGCKNPKKYRSTKTLDFACSMEHLKQINTSASV